MSVYNRKNKGAGCDRKEREFGKVSIEGKRGNPTNGRMDELIQKFVGGDESAKTEIISCGHKAVPALIEAFCSKDEGLRVKAVIVLSAMMPWETMDYLRERYIKTGGIRLTEKEKKAIEDKTNHP